MTQQQQWAKASGSDLSYGENLTETSQYDKSEMIFPIMGGVSLERDKHNRTILKPDSLKKSWKIDHEVDGEWEVTHAMHYIHQSMYYDINRKIEKLNAANKGHKKKHKHDDILNGNVVQVAAETFPVSPLPDKKDAPPSPLPSINDIKLMKEAAAAVSKAVFIQQVGLMDQSKPVNKKRALDQSEASVNVVQSLINRIARRRVVPWIGAGVTYNVYGGWEGVVKLLWEEAGELETYEKCKQMEDLTVLASLAAIKLEQSGKDMWECMAKAFQQMEKRSESVEEGGFTAMSRTLSLLQPIVCGPWPAMITTNWDSLLERAYTTPWYSGIDPRKIHMTDKEDLDMAAKLNSAARREGFKIPRRYRKDVNLFYAEMKSGRRPPPLLKLHGDFTETGAKELVLSHADYRAIMVRDISMNELLRQIASEYSLLFLGTSLRDRDLLGILDEVSEGLGGGIGPHFWLTADELSPARVQHLHINYNTYTIYFDAKKYSFAERLKLVNSTLKELCEFGWIAPTPIVSEAAMTSLAIKKEIASAPFQKLTIPLKNIGLIRLLNCGMQSHKLRGHAAASVAVVPKSNTTDQYQYGGVYGSQVLVELLKEDAKLLSQLEAVRGTLGVDLPSWGGAKDSGITVDNRYHVWLLCGHQSNQGGVPSFVFKAVKDFLTKAFKSYNKDLVVTKKNKNILRMSIPLIASGGGGMTAKQSFCATLSAVGYFFGKKFTGFPPGINFVDIDLYLAQENELSPDNVLNEISEGRIKPGTILSSSGKGVMSLKAIFISLKSHHIAKTVFVNFHSTFKDLLVELGIIVKPNQIFAITIGSGVLAREFTLDTEKNKDMLLIDMGLAEESFIEIMDEKIKRKSKSTAMNLSTWSAPNSSGK